MKLPLPFVRQADKAPPPAFMLIEGPVVRPLPAEEAAGALPRKFWLVQPWVIVTLCLALMIALSIPGLFIDLTRGF